MIFCINTTRGISKLSQISLAKRDVKLGITISIFNFSPVVFMPNITTNHAITYTNISINMDTQIQHHMNTIVSDGGPVYHRRPILAPCGTQLV